MEFPWRKKGWKTVYDPNSVIHHLHGNSTEKVKAFAYTCNICSEIYFCRQYLNMKKMADTATVLVPVSTLWAENA